MSATISDEHQSVAKGRRATGLEQVYPSETASGRMASTTIEYVVGAIGGGSPVHIGDVVKIVEGPLIGQLARYAGTAGRRVLVVVELQGRPFDVEMDLDWVVATAPERKSASELPRSQHLA